LKQFGIRMIEAGFHDEAKFEMRDLERPKTQKREARGEEFLGLENCAIDFT